MTGGGGSGVKRGLIYGLVIQLCVGMNAALYISSDDCMWHDTRLRTCTVCRDQQAITYKSTRTDAARRSEYYQSDFRTKQKPLFQKVNSEL